MKLKSILLSSIITLNAAAQHDLTGRPKGPSLELSKETRDKVEELIDADAAARKLKESARAEGVESVKVDKGLLIAIPDKKEDQEKFRALLDQIKDGNYGDFIKGGDYLIGDYLIADKLAKKIEELNIRISVLDVQVRALTTTNEDLRSRERRLLAKLAKSEIDVANLLEIIAQAKDGTGKRIAVPNPADQ